MKRILGIDLGQARIGLAVSDELQFLAHPIETIKRSQHKNAVARVAEVVREKDVGCVVIGLPRHLNGAIGAAANDALAFAEKLRAIVPCEVRTWDERFTTVAAHAALRESGKSSRQTRGYVDQVAAQIILQSYLDSLPANRDQGEATPDI